MLLCRLLLRRVGTVVNRGYLCLLLSRFASLDGGVELARDKIVA